LKTTDLENDMTADVYLAGPLFTPYERDFIDSLAAQLRSRGISVFVPHEAVTDFEPTAAAVYEVDAQGLLGARVVLAILDGTSVDDGTACEIGMFQQAAASDPTKRGVVGLVTDLRLRRGAGGDVRLNLFVRGCIQQQGLLVTDVDEAVEAVHNLLR
jgi:nucleoside 2-deoxyribosyltransferase